MARWFIAMNSGADGGPDWGPPDIVRCAAELCPDDFDPSHWRYSSAMKIILAGKQYCLG